MQIVVDANIIISCLISGNTSELVFSPALELAAPELLFTEIRKHEQEILSKSSLSDAEFDLLLLLLKKQIRIIQRTDFASFMPKAEQLLGEHKKDSPYIALALHLNCPFWTYEKRFIKIEEVEILTSSDVKARIKELN